MNSQFPFLITVEPVGLQVSWQQAKQMIYVTEYPHTTRQTQEFLLDS